MKYRVLAVFPFVFASVFVLAALGDDSRPAVLLAQNQAGKILSFVGCFLAALAFERGEYLRRAWSFNALCELLLLAGNAVGTPVMAGHLSAVQIGVAQGAFVTLANASCVVGLWMIAHAFRAAGLEEDDEARRRRHTLFAGAIVVSLAITGWPLVQDLRSLAGGDPKAMVSIASDLGDTICLALVAPVLQTALAMRGGVLVWPWAFLTASGVAWVAFDASSGIIAARHIESAGWLVFSEAMRALGAAYFCCAGLAQRLTVDPEGRPSLAPPAPPAE